MTSDPDHVRRVVERALAEDVGKGDVTTACTVPAEARARAELVARQDLVVAGLEVALAAFRQLDPEVAWQAGAEAGQPVARGVVLGRLEGRARALLTAERVALNFLQRLSGIATLTRRFVEAVAGTKARVRDTRKTTPLLRALEKEAVAVGGGEPHRFSLDAAVLVKDNHVRLAGSVAEATRRALRGAEGLEVEIEVDRLEQIADALAAGARLLLLDNFTPAEVREAVGLVAGRARLEASGGIRLENVRAYAEAGVDYVAVGALTHSAPAADISLEIYSI